MSRRVPYTALAGELLNGFLSLLGCLNFLFTVSVLHGFVVKALCVGVLCQ